MLWEDDERTMRVFLAMYHTRRRIDHMSRRAERMSVWSKTKKAARKTSRAVGNYAFNVVYAFDQLACVTVPFLFGPYAGQKDETISSAMGKLAATNNMRIPWKYPVAKAASGLCNIFEKDHALKSIENDEGKTLSGETMLRVANYLERSGRKK